MHTSQFLSKALDQIKNVLTTIVSTYISLGFLQLTSVENSFISESSKFCQKPNDNESTNTAI